ncbi:hypothetical protein [uncultured Fusobacterium sp.]|uniref:hypothetical protein n=1 Tax=uncultured Fusobacterium sp. TaxID=159267 RepID=UPI002592471A|nr:hypothetical protein [uncultured Fusobacterium sp.]
MFLELDFKGFEKLLKEAENNQLRAIISGNDERIEFLPYGYQYELKTFNFKIIAPKDTKIFFEKIHRKILEIKNKKVTLKSQIEDIFTVKIHGMEEEKMK